MKLFAFGLGYCARHYIARSGQSFESIAGTVRDPAKAKELAGQPIETLLFSAEHEFEITKQSTGFIYRQEDLEKTVALALFAFLEGVAHWIGYYHDLGEDDPIQLRMGKIAEAFNAVSVLE